MVFDYRADGRCCTKMLSQPNLRSCSLRWRQAQGSGRRTRGKRNAGERARKREEEIKARKAQMEQLQKWASKRKGGKKQSGKNKRMKKEQKGAGLLESTTGVVIRKWQNDKERTLSLLLLFPFKDSQQRSHNKCAWWVENIFKSVGRCTYSIFFNTCLCKSSSMTDQVLKWIHLDYF